MKEKKQRQAMEIGHLTPNWTESISCWYFAQMFSHFRGPSITGQGATDSFGPPQAWVPKEPSKLCKQMFRQQKTFSRGQAQAVSQLFSAFSCIHSSLCLFPSPSFSLISLSSSSPSLSCVSYVKWKPARATCRILSKYFTAAFNPI